MEDLPLKLASLPWPMALLGIMIIVFIAAVLFMYLPLLDEVNRLKDNEDQLLSNIKDSVLSFESVILSSLNSCDISDKIKNEIAVLQGFNENRFDSVLSITDEIVKLNHDLNTLFEKFDNEFKEKVRIELKDVKDFNKENFINIITILHTMESTNRDLVTNLDKLSDEIDDLSRQVKDSCEKNTDTIKEKITNMSTQIESMKEKVSMLAMTIRPSPFGQ